MYSSGYVYQLDTKLQSDSLTPLIYRGGSPVYLSSSSGTFPNSGIKNEVLEFKDSGYYLYAANYTMQIQSYGLEMVFKTSLPSVTTNSYPFIGFFTNENPLSITYSTYFAIYNGCISVNYVGTTSTTSYYGTFPINDNIFHHIFIRDDNNYVYIYCDGKLVDTLTTQPNNLYYYPQALVIGNPLPAYPLVDSAFKFVRVFPVASPIQKENILDNYYSLKPYNSSTIYINESNLWYKTEQRRY